MIQEPSVKFLMLAVTAASCRIGPQRAALGGWVSRKVHARGTPTIVTSQPQGY